MTVITCSACWYMGRLFIALSFLFAVAGAQTPTLADSPRDAEGRLQPFDCGRAVHHGPQECNPVEFSNVLKQAKTVAVVVIPSPSMKEPEPILRMRVEALVRKWRRFRLVHQPDNANLVFQLLSLSVPTGSLGEKLPEAQVLVWPFGRNPQKDAFVWAETYVARWPKSDAVAAVVKLLRRDIEDCKRLSR